MSIAISLKLHRQPDNDQSNFSLQDSRISRASYYCILLNDIRCSPWCSSVNWTQQIERTLAKYENIQLRPPILKLNRALCNSWNNKSVLHWMINKKEVLIEIAVFENHTKIQTCEWRGDIMWRPKLLPQKTSVVLRVLKSFTWLLRSSHNISISRQCMFVH